MAMRDRDELFAALGESAFRSRLAGAGGGQ
jgi:hypothetical protein